MNIDRGSANLELLTTWLANRIQVHTKYSIKQEIRRGLRTCVTCEHFDKDNETCKLTEGLRPPATVIAHGCDRFIHEHDNIPF
jgi:hypothetical protein